jgi:hypothetical protein
MNSSRGFCLALACIVVFAVGLIGCGRNQDTTTTESPIENQPLGTETNEIDAVDVTPGVHDANAVAGLVAARAERTSNGPRIKLVSRDRIQNIHHVDWMTERKEKQLATAPEFTVFHDFQFTDQRPESGITFRHYAVDCSARNYKSVHYDHGNGVAVADVDGDGLFDIYFTTQVGRNELWRNQGNGRFENITESAGVAVEDRISVTASFVDIENDGDADLYVTSVRGGNLLFANDGTGKFTDITADSGLGYRGHSSSAVFFDYDRDGLVDMFLTNVGTYTSDELVSATSLGHGEYRYYLGLLDGFSGHLKPDRTETSVLYKNLGDGRFRDVSQEMELVDETWTGDATPIDGNRDGWLDLYVLNMEGHDEYYENVAGTKFVRRSRDVFPRTPWGSMGVKVFDFDNDGQMDIYVTDMHSDMSIIISPNEEKQKANMQFPASFLRSGGMSIYGNAFFKAQDKSKFEEVSDTIGAENYWPWGLSVGDLNADGYGDVFVTSCMNYPFRYGVNSVLLNNQGKKLLDSEFIVGVEPRRDNRTATPYFTIDCANDVFTGETKDMLETIRENVGHQKVEVWGMLGSRSSAIFDLDNDGDLDIVTNDFHSEPMVLISNLSDTKEINHVKIQLAGTSSNRDGLGAQVTVRTASGSTTQNHDGKSGYMSQSRIPLYFGLGDSQDIEEITVSWPSGKIQTLSEGMTVNGTVTITEE